MSNNVELVTTLPNPGVIGARFRGDYMYVTSVSGLTVYDVATDPANPTEAGRLPLPHFENEDVDLGGDILLISNDAAESTGILHVIDISEPTSPTLLTSFQMGGNPVEGGAGHTASCILKCKFAWVTDTGEMKVIDLRDPSAPVDLGNFAPPIGGLATHDVQVDGNGIAWVAGFNGTAGYKIPAGYDSPDDAKLVARTNAEAESTYDENFGTGDGSTFNDFIHHNSLRNKGGDVLYVTEEDYTRPGCAGAGSFQTWKVPTNGKGLPTGKDLTPLDMWATEAVTEAMNTAPGSNNPVTVMCSAHYFTLERNIVAQGWYEQGVRFLDVSDPKNIRQIGYYIPPSAMTWAAHFPPTDKTLQTAYVFDATHGIDVLRINRPAKGALSAPHVACKTKSCQTKSSPKARTAPILDEWMTGTPGGGTPNGPFGFACRLGLANVVGGVQLKVK
jgi:hypothetical protein